MIAFPLTPCGAGLILALAISHGPAHAQTPARTEIASRTVSATDAALTPDAISAFIANYYRAPDPKAVPAMVKAALDAGLLEQQNRRMVMIGFMAGLIATDASVVDRLAPLFEKLPGDQPMRLPRAIAYSGRPDWSLHTARLKNLWPARAQEIETLAAKGGRPIPLLKTDNNPLIVDMNWAYFGATGQREAIDKIIAVLATASDSTNPQSLLTAQTAKWSLIANAAQHPRVMEICREHLAGPQAEQIKEIIAAADDRVKKLKPAAASSKASAL